MSDRILAFVLALSVLSLGCGKASEFEPTKVPTTGLDVAVRQKALTNTLNTFLRGVELRDAALILGVLSSERRALVSTAGGIERIMDQQAAALRRQLDGPVDLERGARVLEVRERDEGRVLEVLVSVNEIFNPKPVYFIWEEAEYKINFLPPRLAQQTSSLSSKLDPDAGSIQPLIAEDRYRISNRFSETRAWAPGCPTCTFPPVNPYVVRSITAHTTVYEDTQGDFCPAVFLNGHYFAGRSGGGVWSNNFLCVYQWFGDDFFNSAQDQWQCTQHCP